MQLRKTKNGERYRVEIRFKNGARISKTFSRKSDGKAWKARTMLEFEKDEARGFTVEKKKRITLSQFANEWLEGKVKNQCSKSTYDYYQNTFKKKIIPLLGGIYLDQLKRSHGDRLVGKLQAQGHVPKGVNLIVGVLKTALNEAVRLEYLLRSPLFGYKKLKLPPAKDIFWTKLEIDQFLRANLLSPYYPVFVLALNTGLRRGEIAGLCWDRVDLVRNVLEITRIRDRHGFRDGTKSSKKRMVPLNPQARLVLVKLLKRQLNPKFVFCDDKGKEFDFHHLYREFKMAQKKAGLENIIHFHALRHTFASHFMMNAGNLYDLQKILGHSQIDMTERYSHLSPEHLGKVIEIVGFGERDDASVTPKDFEDHKNILILGT
jgi:integrase